MDDLDQNCYLTWKLYFPFFDLKSFSKYWGFFINIMVVNKHHLFECISPQYHFQKNSLEEGLKILPNTNFKTEQNVFPSKFKINKNSIYVKLSS